MRAGRLCAVHRNDLADLNLARLGALRIPTAVLIHQPCQLIRLFFYSLQARHPITSRASFEWLRQKKSSNNIPYDPS